MNEQDQELKKMLEPLSNLKIDENYIERWQHAIEKEKIKPPQKIFPFFFLLATLFLGFILGMYFSKFIFDKKDENFLITHEDPATIELVFSNID